MVYDKVMTSFFDVILIGEHLPFQIAVVTEMYSIITEQVKSTTKVRRVNRDELCFKVPVT